MSKPSKPTRMQMKVLKAVHTQAAMARVMQDRAKARQQATGHPPPSSWFEDFHGHALLRQQLENAAAAAAIPAAWVEQCRQRGDLGIRWRADLHWREPDSVDRELSLAELARQVRHVQGIAGIAATYSERGARAEVGTAQLFDRKLRVLAQHARAIASVLDISSHEADRLWGRHTWASVAENVRGLEDAALAARWRAHANANTTNFALQAKALGYAGLPPETGLWAQFDPAHMVDEIRTRLSARTSQQGSTPQPGTQITEAIDVAGIDADTNTPLDTDTSRAPTPVQVTLPGIEP
ncbi:hypothetical protein ACFXO9_26795 [Nocardia tengchongensis]|uniref:hypothetical protein n=1 Tax=Nocardia tengchongensis TaxID=2055889 RepID=UPI0036812243